MANESQNLALSDSESDADNYAQRISGPPQVKPEEVQLIRVLGRGTFGEVWLAHCRSVEVAAKIPNPKRKFTPQQLAAFMAEVEIMSKIYHPNVSLFMGASIVDPAKIIIVTEKLEGDVETLLRTKNGKVSTVSLDRRLKMARDAAQGVAWLHGMDPICLHRDLKTSNLLFDKNYTVKVCDFGLSQLFDRGTMIEDENLPKGTPLYMAPEVLRGEKFNEKSDVYSFGIVLWEMMTGSPPFSHHSDLPTFVKAICDDKERPVIPPHLPHRLKELMQACWYPDQTRRPSFPQIIDQLNQIIIEVAIPDQLGRKMWQEHFSNLEKVAWTTFMKIFYFFIGVPLPKDNGEPFSSNPEIQKLRALKALLAPQNDEVNIKRFGDILGWFGPLSLPYKSGAGILDTVYITLSDQMDSPNCWFHGDVSSQKAESQLNKEKPGSFMVRFSTNPEHPTWFTISRISHRAQASGHIRISHEPGGVFIVLDPKRPARSYNSLYELVRGERSPDRLGITEPLPSPYQHLFQGGHILCGYDIHDYESDDDGDNEDY